MEKGNPTAPLVGMQTSAATLVGSMEFHQKTTNETALGPSDPTSGYVCENPKIPKNICAPTFLVVLFTIAKIWKQPKCPSVND